MQVLKHRYERLRGVSGRIQNALGDLAGMGERLHSLLSWRDPRFATYLHFFQADTNLFASLIEADTSDRSGCDHFSKLLFLSARFCYLTPSL